MPETAKRLGLVVTKSRDDRLNTTLATKAALTYLQMNYEQFRDWKLAIIAYEIGERKTAELINATGSHDPEVIASAASAPAELKKFNTRVDAFLVIMHNPKIISS